jgi:hypothetical protein
MTLEVDRRELLSDPRHERIIAWDSFLGSSGTKAYLSMPDGCSSVHRQQDIGSRT